ncbi:MAG: orotidine-5'-phosphate decarboxylase [Candidatus Acidiferrales bacterium]
MAAMKDASSPAAAERLIVALDLPSTDAALRMAEKLHGHAGMFKVGMELFGAEGPALPRQLVSRSEGVFLDLKFHDIPNTVRAAAREAAQLGVRMINVHASGGRQMMAAAREGAESAGARRPLALAVTVLTSLAAEDLSEIGLAGTPEEAVIRLARLAQSAGMDGVVASAREAAAIREACGSEFVIVTPGIRPAASAVQDQARVSTPADAIRAGADYLVVGRPITGAADPAAAAEAVAAEIQLALSAAGTERVHHG